MNKWNYNNPRFEADDLNYELLAFAPWSGHRNFAYDFMECFRPGVLAELGSHYGCSAFAFAQGAKDFCIDTNMYFIDTWQGDDFTRKYNNDVYAIFNKTVDTCFAYQNINMLRMTFDEALDKFENESIDLLHIDGSHYYDDVKRDFEGWLPKVKRDGIIMLHDTSSDIVLGDIMGSHKYWLELSSSYEHTCSFDFSWGLGIIFLDSEKYEYFIKNVDLTKYQRNNNALDVEYKDILRKNYFALKDKEVYIEDLLKQREILNTHLSAYSSTVEEKDKYIEEILIEKENIAKNFETERKKIITDYEAGIADTKNHYEETLLGKDKYINDLENNINNMATAIADLNSRNAALEEAYHKSVNYKLSQLKSKFKK